MHLYRPQAWLSPLAALIILIAAILAGAPAFAQEEPVWPRTRPVETDDLGEKPLEVPGQFPNLFSTLEAKSKAEEQNAVMLEAVQAALDAELAATEKQGAAARSAAALKAWFKQVGVLNADLNLARKGQTATEATLAKYLHTLTAKSTLKDRAKVADLQARVLSAKMHVQQFLFHWADQSQKLMAAQRVHAENRWFAAEAELKAILLRQKASAYSARFKVTEADITTARQTLEREKRQMSVAGTGHAGVQAKKEEAAKLYAQFKAEQEAAALYFTEAKRLVADKIKWDEQAAAKTAGIELAIQEVKDAEADVAALTGDAVTAQAMADGRLKVAKARQKIGDLKAETFEIYVEVKRSYTAAENHIAPLTPALQAELIAALNSYLGKVDEWISQSDEQRKVATAHAKTAKARADLVRSTEAEKDAAQAAIAGLESSLGEAKASEAQAQARLAGMKVGKNAALEIATAQSQLTQAKLKTATADLALATGLQRLAAAKVAFSKVLAETEAELYAIFPRQVPDTSAADQNEKSLADSEAKTKGLTLIETESLNETAQERTRVVQHNDENVRALIAKYQKQFKKAGEAQALYHQAVKEGRASMDETPGPLTLASARLRVGEALLVAQKAWLDNSRQFAELTRARIELAKASAATESELRDLAPEVGSVPKPGDSNSVLNATLKAIAMWESAIVRTQSAIDAAVEFKEQMRVLTANLNDAKENLQSITDKIANREAAVKEMQDAYDAMVAKPPGAEEVAEQRVELDSAKSRLAETLSQQAHAEVKVAEANLERDTVEALIDTRIASLMSYPREDMRVADEGALAAAKTHAEKMEREAKWAADSVNYSIYAVDEIARKEDELEVVVDARKAAEKELAQTMEDRTAAHERSKTLLETAQESIAEVAARTLPKVFSDSQIASYQATLQLQADLRVKNNLDLAAAKNKEINAQVNSARADKEMYKDSITLAEAKLDEARIRYQIETSRRDAYQRTEATLALAAKEDAEESLTDAHRAYEAAHMQLTLTLDLAVGVKEEYLVALAAAGQKDGEIYIDIDQTIDKLKEEKAEVEAEKIKVSEARRKREFAELAAVAEHAEALATGRVRKEVSLNSLVKQKMRELVGHECSSKDTDALTCLACNTVMEMRIDEDFAGKLLPSRTVMIRYYKDLDFYSKNGTVCGIVWKSMQYSWTRKAEAFKDRHILKTDTDSIKASLIGYYESEMPYPEPLTHYLSPAAMTQDMPSWWYTCNNDMHYKIGLNIACYDTSGRNYKFDEVKYSSEARRRARSVKLSRESYLPLLPEMPVPHKRK